MKIAALFWLPALFVLSSVLACSHPRVHEKERTQVILVSWDGLRPAFYEDPKFHTPHLRELMKKGAWAQGSIPVYPSVTYPNHTSMITGVDSQHHGIYSNTVFDPKKGSLSDWYWESSSIKVPTLWKLAKQAGMKTAALGWPVTVSADIDYLVPEVFRTDDYVVEHNWELIKSKMNPDFLHEIDEATQPYTIKTLADSDHWEIRAAVYLLKNKHPDLMLIHLSNGDHIEHGFGPDSTETKAAVEELDRDLGELMNAIDFNHTLLVVTGDHGFAPVTHELNPNALLMDHGWIKLDSTKKHVQSWEAMVHVSGASGALYLKNTGDAAEMAELRSDVVTALRRQAHGHYRILDRHTLDQLGAFPNAVCVLEPAQDYTLTSKLTAQWLSELPRTHGNHGYLPSNPAMQTGFVAVGPGVQADKNLGTIHLLDIAPTLAEVLGLSLPGAQNKPLSLNH